MNAKIEERMQHQLSEEMSKKEKKYRIELQKMKTQMIAETKEQEEAKLAQK